MRYLLYLIPIFYFLLPFAPLTRAETLNSDSYTIRMGNFNMTSGLKSSASYSLTDTVGQIAAEFFASNGYHVKTGFQYIYTLYDFSFVVSSLLVDLGNLTPNTFSSSSNTLTVTAPGQGYSVTVHALAPLKSGESTIPSVRAGNWATPSDHGFGFNLLGDDVVPEFTSPLYFRPFPLLSEDASPLTIMTSVQAGKNRTSTATYQVSVSQDQPPGSYSTQIVYIATPVY